MYNRLNRLVECACCPPDLPRRHDPGVVVGEEEGLEHGVGRPLQPLDALLPLLLEPRERRAVLLGATEPEK